MISLYIYTYMLIFPYWNSIFKAVGSTHLLLTGVRLIPITNWWYPCTYFNALPKRVRIQAKWKQPLSFRGLHWSERFYQQAEALLLYCSQETPAQRVTKQVTAGTAGPGGAAGERGWIMAPVQGRMKTALVMPTGHRGHTGFQMLCNKTPSCTAVQGLTQENTHLHFN